ncbi:Histidine kinase [Algoriphagus alkaliphilus]|uniref:Histidine kinase n=1 Tax=Algoriphagus alkaliphilus TaxID=279824 RepID=A0A1G5Z4C7_9BACT|nr:histidine kinase [Algoriphagus alkaliphilus]SDA89889.1 Histidine kinase [Algoriphagus alkaliphilus]
MQSKSLDFRQVEWWIVTTAVLTAFLFVLFGYRPQFYNDSGMAIFQFASRLLILAALYSAFHLIHMVLIPKYQTDSNKWPSVLWIVFTGIASFGIIAIFGFNSDLIKAPFPAFYLGVIVLYVCYLLAAHILNQALTPPKVRDFQLYNLFRLILSYLFTLFSLIQLEPIVNNGPAIIFSVFIPIIFIASLFNFYLVYGKRKKGQIKQSRWYNWGLMAIILIGALIISVESNHEEIFVIGGLGTVAFIQLIFFPLTSLLFKKYDSYIGQISTLSYQVNQGEAGMDFLRSQINPHFLFNALNTLYASSLMENAEKTSDGIQKLGDMMRFMLHENQLPRIPLSREINYLRNYLDLQMLRFGSQDNLDIDIQINENQCTGEIAPMLLIPFVENAFKHGISAKEKSWIKLNLRCIAGSVHLDLVNSTHPEKPASEKSREESGIGLENVKSRLQLVYPDRHNLNIVSNDTDFFVHLSIQLN